MSIQKKYEYLEKAYPDMLEGIGVLIQKAKVSGRFKTIALLEEEVVQLQKAKELCELKIIELWDNCDEIECKALCSTYFDISSVLPLNLENDLVIYDLIKLITFGYLGEHWHLVRQYLKTNEEQIESIHIGEKWNLRLLNISFKAVVHLIKKESWNEISRAVELINQLRKEQKDFESKFLNQVSEESRPFGAAELVSLYHFAKCVDIMGNYLIEGHPLEPETELRYYIGIAKEYAQKSGNISLELLYQFFEAFAVKMVRNTIWHTTRGINNWVTRFNQFITKEKNGLFELLYPQRESIREGQLLNLARRAVVVNLPTSSGKTLIAEYRILQALNQFKERGGWVAYVVPTKALVNQIYIQLKRDLSNIGIKIEKASGAIELDGFEQYLIEGNGSNTEFDILITTYEKMNLLVRQGLGTTNERPLVLTVVDEAHNIEEEQRGLNLELLLSTIKNDCAEANFLLITPDISNADEVANWLAPERGQVINLELDWWQPNERIVGAIEVDGRGRKYNYTLRALQTVKGTFKIGEGIILKSIEDADEPAAKARTSKLKIATKLSSFVANLVSPIIVLASSPSDTFKIAEQLYESIENDIEKDEDVELVIKLVQSELGAEFPLSKYLRKRIAVHSSALPDEVRYLIEDMMVQGKLQALVATTTIAQGINFPVSTVIMSTYSYPSKTGAKEMPVRDFWNLAGRVGRAGQDNMGWIGIAIKDDNDFHKVTKYVKSASEKLQSQLINAIDIALGYVDKDFGYWLSNDVRWSAILQFISHLRRQTRDQDKFLSQLEMKLQSTLGFNQLSKEKKKFLSNHLRRYASTLSLEDAERADKTGFSSISVRKMIGKLANSNIRPQDWQRNQLFSEHNQAMQKLVGIMLTTDEIKNSIQELAEGDKVLDRSSIARLIIDWVNGKEIAQIASRLHPGIEKTKSIEKTTKALYKVVANAATWGLAAIQKMPTSGIDWDNLSNIEQKKFANLPAYLHYGVNTDEGVLMRKNNVPRSIANRLGKLFAESVNGDIFNQPSESVNEWLKKQSIEIWDAVKPAKSKLTGEDYRQIWRKLNGVN